MKNLITLSLVLITSIGAYAQWDPIAGGINYAGGNVGIGTTTPLGKLDVRGDVRSNSRFTVTGAGSMDMQNTYDILLYANNSLKLSGGGGSLNHITILSGGNVGIGTGSPTAKLEVILVISSAVRAHSKNPLITFDSMATTKSSSRAVQVRQIKWC